MKLNLALEWFLNPDHLPFVLGVQTEAFKKAGLEVNIIEPKEHYDGFEQLKSGEIDIHVNEPIHLFEHYFDGMKSLGCYFETNGGFMIKKDSIKKLKSNQPIKITTPAANPVTNRVGFEILSRYAKKEGFALDIDNVTFYETDFCHIKNMQEGDYDGAWLCFYNFEVIEANHIGFEHLFIDQTKSPYPNFSALELISTKEIISKNKEAIRTFMDISKQMVEFAKQKPVEARTYYYDYAKEERSELMDKIIDDTITRFYDDFTTSPSKWRELYEMLEEFGFCDLDLLQYNQIWKN